ncbi:MAG: glutamate-5-semialdehyde dehydrogenase [Clostridia bacterium]|nr:glutamate-5-semialdehyde dehydrogenase [Clostridia bacterium]
MTTQEKVLDICKRAKEASRSFAAQNTKKKNEILIKISNSLMERRDEIVAANKLDLDSAEANGVPKPMLDRLMLNERRIHDIADSLLFLTGLKDPVGSGEVFTTPNGLEIACQRVPLGVVAIIYEARPNVTVDAAALCLKTGNAVVLRGGREAVNTNLCLIDIMKDAIKSCRIDPDILGFVEPGEGHESANVLMGARGLVDVLIPRGGKRLIQAVVTNAKVPVIETGAGNCHLYVDESADLAMAINVAINAKCSRPAVCNAIETMLVHRSVANEFLPKFVDEVGKKYALEIRGCAETQKIVSCKAATDEDFDTEYDDFILAVKIVGSTEEAVEHINKYNTGHSEAIITNDEKNAEYFRKYVDAAAVYVNASTRFTDGGEFGFGAEIGISTQKLHARGPMGLAALTTQKYLIRGEGQIR